MHQLTAAERATLIERYAGRFSVPCCSYGTVEDYCDSCDNLPRLSSVQNDLKDLQRPWTVKATLGLLPPPARLLEIGAGEPLVASYLAQLGYDVTVVDPYDGSAGGPRQFELFRERYPEVRIVCSHFHGALSELTSDSFDAIYSVSVLEHVPEPALGTVFEGVFAYLRPGGHSFHSVDCVVQGRGTDYHLEQAVHILNYQHKIGHMPLAQRADLSELITQAEGDVETCYLSAAGHNLWRGQQTYQAFPFRKVLSLQLAAKYQTDAA